MKVIFKYFIDRPLLVNMFTVMVLIAGAISMYTLQKETFPQVNFDVVIISTVYPGASSEDVEKLVTISLERKIKEVDGIKKLNAISGDGVSLIYLEIEPDNDLNEILTDVRTAIDLVDDLPEEAKEPVIKSLNNKQRGIIRVTVTGNDYSEMRDYAKLLRNRLEDLPDTASVVMEGYLVDDIKVSINLKKLNQSDLTVEEVALAVKNRNINLSAGKIKKITGDITIRTLAEFESPEDVGNVVIRSNSSGSKVYVKDIADVRRIKRDSDIRQRANEEPAIFLSVKIKEHSDILKSAKALKLAVAGFIKNNPNPHIKQFYTDDISYYVKRRLSILSSNGKVGMVLVFFALLLFLNLRTSFMTSLGAPIAFMISFGVMEYTGMSINLISMFALILVLGMLVDDSIIVAEQFYQNLENKMEPKEAAIEAASVTFVPVIGTILTTMIAFGSLFFMGGIMGKFLWPVPEVVIICLFASFIECFFILPSHLAEYCRLDKKKKTKRWYDPLLKSYSKSLDFFLKKPWSICLTFGAIFIFTMFVATKMRFELFPGDDMRIAFVQLKGDVGDSLDKTDLAMKKLEKISLKHLKKGEYEQIRAQVGMHVGEHGNKTGSHYGSLILYLTPPADRERSTDAILTEIEKAAKSEIKGYHLNIRKVQGGPPVGRPVEIDIKGDKIKTIQKAAKEVLAVLKKQKGVQGAEMDFELGKKQITVAVDEVEAKRLGVDTKMLAFALRQAFAGDAVTKIRENDEDIDVKVMLSDNDIKEEKVLSKIHILNKVGRRIPISRFVKLSKQPGAFIIRRLNRKRIISVSSSLNKEITTPVAIAKTLKPILKKINLKYPKLSFELGGENKDTKESMFRLAKSALMAVSLIFLILVVMFSNLRHSFVVMSAIPLGLIGVILTFLITGKALGFMAAMGVVALVGVVVNDSIVLVSFINETRKTNDNLFESVKIAAKSRFRPIILTTITTFAGLVPIAHPMISKILTFGSKIDSDPFLQPMALSFAWGLLFGTFITLIFVPCLYLVVEETRIKIKSHFDSSDKLSV